MQSFQNSRPRRHPLLWLFFGLFGRISRRVYWLAFFFLRCIQAALLAQLLGGEEASLFRPTLNLGPIVLLISLYATVAISVKRLHDVGYTGFFSLATFVPVVDLAFSIWVGLLPGTAGPNRFGTTTDVPPA